jgi:hypothetical protein
LFICHAVEFPAGFDGKVDNIKYRPLCSEQKGEG